jgi:predicted CoA-substrate-specific enzyme activase
MFVAGIDAGFQTVKIVILKEDEVVSSHILTIGKDAIGTAVERAVCQATDRAGISSSALEYIAATGAFRRQVTCARGQLPESLCLAKGIDRLASFSGVVLDIGAQKALALKCRQGIPLGIARSDRCAAGAGEYLEMVAKVLEIDISEMGKLYMNSREFTEIQSTCTVFAESEIISLIHQRKSPEDIMRGAIKGFAARIHSLLLTIGMTDNVCMVGGVARNSGVVKAMEERIGRDILVPANPDIVGALGAAMAGKEQMGAAK